MLELWTGVKILNIDHLVHLRSRSGFACMDHLSLKIYLSSLLTFS